MIICQIYAETISEHLSLYNISSSFAIEALKTILTKRRQTIRVSNRLAFLYPIFDKDEAILYIGYQITSDISDIGKRYPTVITQIFHNLSTAYAKISHFLKNFTCDIMHLSTKTT
jgi:hypothetical protein